MRSTKATRGPSTKPKKSIDSHFGKNSHFGTNCDDHNSQTSLNHKPNEAHNLRLLHFGELATKIVIGYYYKGSATIHDIKHEDHFPEAYRESAYKLVKKGILNKNGILFSLTEEGRVLASDFINYFRDKHAVV